MRTRFAIASLLTAAAVTLVGCGGGTSSPAGDDAFNDADVTFAQGMVVHHQQAIEMSQLVESRASDPEVKQLAADIEAAQGPEINTMTGWLKDWDEEVPSADGGMEDMDGMDHGDMDGMSKGDMDGMMTEQDMSGLEAAQAPSFDRMFLTMMIEHHQGAVEVAETEQAEGENAEAVALAEKIAADQQAELQDMQDLLES